MIPCQGYRIARVKKGNLCLEQDGKAPRMFLFCFLQARALPSGPMARYRLDSLSDFARRGYDVRILCLACGHRVDVNAVILMQRVHEKRISKRIDHLEFHLRCSVCGGKRTHVTPVESEF